MDADEARRLALAGDLVLVDIRNPDEWRATGVGDAARPISMRDPAFLDKLKEALGGDAGRTLALICASGGRSAYVAGELVARGYSDVHNVAEGMMGSAAGPGWLGRGLPVRPPEA